MSQQRIVCTGDEAFGLEVRRLVLKSFGYNARVLPDCAATSQSIAVERTDLVILDYSELTHGQTECIRALRASHPRQRILLVAPVPYVDNEVTELVDCVLLKGSSPEEFRSAVQSCIGNEGGQKMLAIATFIGTFLGIAVHRLIKKRKTSSIRPTSLSTLPAPEEPGRTAARSAHL